MFIIYAGDCPPVNLNHVESIRFDKVYRKIMFDMYSGREIIWEFYNKRTFFEAEEYLYNNFIKYLGDLELSSEFEKEFENFKE